MNNTNSLSFSSPPRKQAPRSGLRNLSGSARASRVRQEPWRKRFQDQCLKRLNRAREASFMAHRQINQSEQKDQPELSESEMYGIIRDEWLKFKESMEGQLAGQGMDQDLVEEMEELYHDQILDGLANDADEYEMYQMYEDEMFEADIDLYLLENDNNSNNGNNDNNVNMTNG